MIFQDEDFDRNVHHEFFLSVYAFFTKWDEAIAIDILEGMKQIEQLCPECNFKINIVFTREKGGAWLSKQKAIQILLHENMRVKIS